MIEIKVLGSPAPQGSKRAFVNKYTGKAALIESSKAVKPWREAVKHAAIEAMGQAGLGIKGAVKVEMVFTMLRPKSAKRGAVPCTRPDLSKLIRSTEDALTDVGAWEDDARIVQCSSAKVFPGEGKDALAVPGAVIRISAVLE